MWESAWGRRSSSWSRCGLLVGCCIDSGVDVQVFCGSAGVVQAVEIYRGFDFEPRARVLLNGIDVFSVPADQMIAELRVGF
ncbi:hypothetical protein [Nonomuraea sp. NPDC049709]|uniref:hypothetical protein n=1 Tax=Nonomuraea sp. NPDC049709 TaxID=3154736 RepID=UPI0034150C70